MIKADIGGLTETKMKGQVAHNKLIRAFNDYGFHCISHNSELPDGEGEGPSSAGVLLIASKTKFHSLDNPKNDIYGRVLAATVTTTDGNIRIIVVYGPSGATSPCFESNENGKNIEKDTVVFIKEEQEDCRKEGMICLVIGDLHGVHHGSLMSRYPGSQVPRFPGSWM